MAFLLVVAGGSAATVVTSGSALAAGGALTAAAAPKAAPAAPAPNGSCGMASPGTGPYASTLCWLDMTSYNIVAAATGQQITESLPGGYTATFTLTVTGPRALSAYPFPTFSQAYLGTGSYTGVPGKPALYQGLWNSGLGTSAAQNSSTINLSNIVVTDSAGNRVTNYSLVSADAESTDYPSNVAYPESFTWTSDQPFTSLQPLGNSCGGGFTGVGTTTVTCTGGGAGSQQRKTGNAILATTNPSTLTAVVQASASRQGVAFGFLFESVTLNKTVVNAYGGDSFTVDVTGSNGTLQGTASTAPGGASATTGPVTVIGDTAGSMVTLSETAAAANVGTYTPSWSCTSANPGTAGPLPAGNAGLSAQVSLSPGADVVCTITNTTPADPKLTLVKSSTTTQLTQVGQQVPYSFLVTNTGNVTVTDLSVADTQLAPAVQANMSAVSCPSTTLAAGQSVTCTGTYTVTQADLDNGELKDSATATGETPSGPVTTPPSAVTIPGNSSPSISIVKSANPTVVAAAGDTVAYSFVVKNTGNVTLHDVAVDDTFTAPAGPALAISCPKTVLAPDESETCTASYSVTQADVDAGSILNSATSTGTPPTGPPVVSPPSTAVVTANPSTGLSLVKSAVLSTDANGDGKAGVGDEISYSFLVANTGAVTLHGVTVADQLVAPAGPALTVTCPAGDLAPGADLTCKASPYVVTQADVDAGSVANSATATGVPPTGPPVVSPPSDTTTPTPSNAGIRLTKVAYLDDRDGDGKAGVGELISYEFTVENTGSVTLTNVHVDDPMLAQRHLTITCPGDSLSPGDVMVCVSSDYTVTQAEVDAGVVANVATATGVPPHGDPVGSPPSKADVPTTTAPPTEEHPASSLAFTGSNVLGAVTLGGLLLLAGLALTLVTSRRRTDA